MNMVDSVEPEPDYKEIIFSYLFWRDIKPVCPTFEASIWLAYKTEDFVFWAIWQITVDHMATYVRDDDDDDDDDDLRRRR